ncbi:molybdenum ABC transporter ATP-binding protein [Actibacterium lipolyticum]|uniref:Maltose/maltodextrin import ATP-binding protein MalK n=1 Tax=Actibacterium lipolyticum TaxID=1524263 RepID=A0A238KK46_9RHOB|nr:molybdenum ABC transporter ATP-binding protein [Actibacterium lipolyticum]SMX43088.1 Maltose/maltodextrin import ATP-binding protein MalK [Actibacterium lipolyticum]
MNKLSLNLQLARGDFAMNIVHDADLTGITALFGPSGAGKSTVLRAIAGLEADGSGRIAFDGDVWQDSDDRVFVPPHKRGVGMVFQDARLFGHLTVAGNLNFADKRSNGASPISRDAVVHALDLGPLLARRPASLSGGERQRVAMGRALLARPRLLLMDEPLSGLDMRRKAQILPYIARLPDAFGLPVLYVTHAIDEVTRIAGDMIVIGDGRVTAAGPLAETFARLDLDAGGSRFEAGVILNARVSGADEAFRLTRLELEGQTLSMPAAKVAVGDVVQLRVRARDVLLATSPPIGLSAQNILSGQVTEIIEETETAFAEVFVAVGSQCLRARVTRAAVSQLGLAVGQPVFAVLKAISFDRRVL